MFNLEDFWKEFDENPEKIMEENLEIKLDNHPYVCMGTFYKTVLEGNGMSNFMLLIFPPQEDKEKFLKSTQEYLYNKAFDNLRHLDFSNEYHLEQIQKHPKSKILEAIYTLIPIFEEKEEYEKCATLKRLERVL